MRAFLIFLLTAVTILAEPETGEEAGGKKLLREGPAKECFLQAWGKGPDWLTQVTVEFREEHLSREMPVVTDLYFEPTGKALCWMPVEEGRKPEVTVVAAVEGRKVLEIVCPGDGSSGRKIETVMVAMETARGSEWFSPFFCGSPEYYRGRFVSGKDVMAGYVATLEWSGTGGYRSHHLFDLRKPNPVMVAKVDAGRVVREPTETDEEFNERNKVFERERDLLSGIIRKE